jgi:hypothetical protein
VIPGATRRGEAMNVGDLAKKIAGLAQVETDMLPFGGGFVWKAPDGKAFAFFQGKPSPLNDKMLVFTMFQNEYEVRVYAVPTKADGDDKAAPTRYTFTKAAPTYFVESMRMETFIYEVADELRELDAATASEDDFTGAANGVEPKGTEPETEEEEEEEVAQP